MPTYLHACQSPECLFEWEDYYSTTKEPPTKCEKCGKETAKRVINSMTKGVVLLEGEDLKQSTLKSAKEYAKSLQTNDNLAANFVGESRFQSNQTKFDKMRK